MEDITCPFVDTGIHRITDPGFIDRLGLAYWRLSRWEWDELLGSKPEGFDELPNVWYKRWPWEKRKPSKEDYVRRPMRAIVAIIGEANVSRCWWAFELGKDFDEWLHWYLTGQITVDLRESCGSDQLFPKVDGTEQRRQ